MSHKIEQEIKRLKILKVVTKRFSTAHIVLSGMKYTITKQLTKFSN